MGGSRADLAGFRGKSPLWDNFPDCGQIESAARWFAAALE